MIADLDQLDATNAVGQQWAVALITSILSDYLDLAGCCPEKIELLTPGILDGPDCIHLAWRYEDSLLAEFAGRETCVTTNFVFTGIMPPRADGVSQEFAPVAKSGIEQLLARRRQRARSPTTQAIQHAARDRDIPVIRHGEWPFVSKGNGSQLDDAVAEYGLGQGLHHVLIRESCVLSQTRSLPFQLADREAQYRMLATAIPVPARDPEFSNVNSARRAVRSAQRIGFPVVLKSREVLPHGGVVLDLRTTEAVEAAFALLTSRSRHMVIERFCPNPVYRLLVVHGDVIAATTRQPFVVRGDGVRTVEQLVASQVDWAQFPSGQSTLQESVRMRLGNALLDRGLDWNDVLTSGLSVVLQSGAEPMVSGYGEDVLPDVRACPLIGEMAKTAVECCGLDVGAVEVAVGVSDDQLDPRSAMVLAVDPVPDLAFHRLQGELLPQNAAALYLDGIGFRNNPSRIPITAVTGTNGKTTTCLMLDHILRNSGLSTGLACTDGFYLDGKRQRRGTFSGISGAIQVFAANNVEAAILETSRGTLLKRGLAFDRCNVAACTNIAADHLGEDGIESLEQLAHIKSTVIRAARDCVVLNGEDAACLEMVSRIQAKRLILVYPSAVQPRFPPDLTAQAEAIICERYESSAQIVWCQGAELYPIVDIDRIPATWAGAAIHNVENAMFAAGLALGLGLSAAQIRDALESFDTSVDCAPGRLNVFDELPFRVVVDYAHNAHGFGALCKFVKNLGTTGSRTLIVFAQERQNQVARREIAAMVAGTFDHFLCRDPIKVEHAEPGQLAEKMREALLEEGVADGAIQVIAGLDEAVEYALVNAKEADLIVVGATGGYRRVWKQLQAFWEGNKLADMESRNGDPSLDGAKEVPLRADQ